jgi:hypothetical protein
MTYAQDTSTKWDVEIPAALTADVLSVPETTPEPLDLRVMHSHVTRMQVEEAAELPELPPIWGTINVTVQLVEDPELPAPPPPLPALSPSDPAMLERLAQLRETYRSTELVFISATVYDGNRTLLRIYPNGRTDEAVTAWSNVDFHHFSGFSTYRVKDAVDGSIHDYGLLMGIGGIDTRRWAKLAAENGIEYKGPEIPELPTLPDLSAGGPAFVVKEGAKSSPAMATLEQIHDLYRKEGVRMEAAYHARIKAREERKAYLLANPPKPEDIVVKFWERDPSHGE